MVFSSAIFVFAFFPIAVIGHLLLKEKYRNIWLLLCSIIFYGWVQPQFLYLLLISVLVNYISALLIEKKRFSNTALIFAILVNVGMLVYFKYFNFILETINSLFSKNIELIDLILPIGISFYTFKGISYVVDVYRGEFPAEKNILNLSVYICMFPQILSGPIDRYGGGKRSD